MEVFLLTATNNVPQLADLVVGAFGDDGSRHLAGDTWLVSRKGISTSSEAYELLKKHWRQKTGSVDGSPYVLVVPTDAYYGYGDVAHWQWVDSRRKQP